MKKKVAQKVSKRLLLDSLPQEELAKLLGGAGQQSISTLDDTSTTPGCGSKGCNKTDSCQSNT